MKVLKMKHARILGFLTGATVMAGFTVTANAATVIPVTGVFGHNERENFGGTIGDMTNGSGMNGFEYAGEPDNNQPPGWPTGYGDPSTWSAGGSSYRDEWQSQDLLGDGEAGEDLPTNGKIGWVIFDLGASTVNLGDLYVWHIRENNGRFVTDFNVYLSEAPTVAPVNGPTSGNSIDYDFSSGGWTSVATGLAGTFQGDQTVGLGGATARYIGLEIIDNNGDNSRAGFAEVGITQQVPEPTSSLMLGLGALALIRRRR